MRGRLVLVAACVPPAVYLFYVSHYAVNAPFSDDWSRIPLVSHALHGRLGLRELWTQYSSTRLFVPNLIFVAFGFIDHLDLKAVVLFSAVIFVATYVLVLILFRSYTTRPLTPLTVLCVGILWFSLVDVENALWAFQIAWYLALFFCVVMISVFFVWPRNRHVALAFAVLAAVGGSLSIVQGFVLWPLGLVCLLWLHRGAHKRYGEVVVWLAAGLLTLVVYLPGYRSGVGCVPVGTNCGVGANASNVGRLCKFIVTLVGNVVPVSVHGYPVFRQSLGAALLLAAAFVIVRSFQERRHETRVPLPLLLIAFALLFDVAIALGRAREGAPAALQSRYSMPNIVLLVGILMYGVAHAPRWRKARDAKRARQYVAVGAYVLLGMLVLTQSYFGTQYGIRHARHRRTLHERNARTVVNLDRIPPSLRACTVGAYVWNYVYPPSSALGRTYAFAADAQRDHLMVFKPATFRKYRAQGAPPVPRQCLARVRAERGHPTN